MQALAHLPTLLVPMADAKVLSVEQLCAGFLDAQRRAALEARSSSAAAQEYTNGAGPAEPARACAVHQVRESARMVAGQLVVKERAELGAADVTRQK